MSDLRVAVIGGGHLGSIHARLLQQTEGARLVAVADTDPEARQRVARQIQAAVVSDYRELIPQIDAAVLAVPTSLHHSIGVRLLEQGIHLLVEKPLACTADDAAALVTAARHARRVLQVGHVEQFNPALTAFRQQSVHPEYIEVARQGPPTFRSLDAGVVLDLMIHDVDVVLSLVQSEVTAVQANGFRWLGPREDVAHARVEFANGCRANLTASRVSSEPCRTMNLFGSDWQTTIDFGNHTVQTVRAGDQTNWQERNLSAAEKQQLQADVFHSVLQQSKMEVTKTNAIADELRDFVDSIRSNRQPQVPGTQGHAAVALCERIVEAIDGVGGPRMLRVPFWDDAARKAG